MNNDSCAYFDLFHLFYSKIDKHLFFRVELQIFLVYHLDIKLTFKDFQNLSLSLTSFSLFNILNLSAFDNFVGRRYLNLLAWGRKQGIIPIHNVHKSAGEVTWFSILIHIISCTRSSHIHLNRITYTIFLHSTIYLLLELLVLKELFDILNVINLVQEAWAGINTVVIIWRRSICWFSALTPFLHINLNCGVVAAVTWRTSDKLSSVVLVFLNLRFVHSWDITSLRRHSRNLLWVLVVIHHGRLIIVAHCESR